MIRIVFEAEGHYMEGLGCDTAEVGIGESEAQGYGLTANGGVIRVRVSEGLLVDYLVCRKTEGGGFLKIHRWELDGKRLLQDWLAAGAPGFWKQKRRKL